MGVGMGKTDHFLQVFVAWRQSWRASLWEPVMRGPVESPFANLSGIQRILLHCRVGKMGYSPPTEVAKMVASGL